MVCRRQYKKYSNAAQYITNMELRASDFKNLVDFEVYKEGGYPKPSTPAKAYNIFDKYDRAVRLMNKYKFTQYADLNREFGLQVTLTSPEPVEHPWMKYEETDE